MKQREGRGQETAEMGMKYSKLCRIIAEQPNKMKGINLAKIKTKRIINNDKATYCLRLKGKLICQIKNDISFGRISDFWQDYIMEFVPFIVAILFLI